MLLLEAQVAPLRGREGAIHGCRHSFAFADSTASKIPSSLEKEIIFKASLGLKKINLDTHNDKQTVVNKISSDEKDASGNAFGFPQLKLCGGFEMMWCLPNCRDLSLIKCSWNAKDLRSNLGGGQGKIYLHSIQRSLSTQPIVAESHAEVKEKCYMCNKEILVNKLRTIYGLVRRGWIPVMMTIQMNPLTLCKVLQLLPSVPVPQQQHNLQLLSDRSNPPVTVQCQMPTSH